MSVKFKRAKGEKDSEEDAKSDITDEDVKDIGDEKVRGSKEKVNDDFETEEEDEEKEEKPFISAAWDILKDVAIAFLIVIIIISSIYIYTGNWPPVVVVESDSMQHSDTESYLGVIDTGDLVLVKAIDSEKDVIPYMKGKRVGHETYGEFGDVLIYRKNGYSDTTPVIHRAIVWLRYNETSHSFDIPELKYHNAPDEWDVLSGELRWYNLTGSIVLKQIGYSKEDRRDIIINLGNILNNYQIANVKPHSGFITLGDHNRGNYDQNMLPDGHGGRVRPVQPEWVVGKARGELPWFGLIKLYFQDNTITERAPQNSFTMLYISLILIFAVPISLDIVLILYDRRKSKMKETEEGEEEEETEDDDKEHEHEEEEDAKKKEHEEGEEIEKDEEEEDAKKKEHEERKEKKAMESEHDKVEQKAILEEEKERYEEKEEDKGKESEKGEHKEEGDESEKTDNK